MANSEILGLAHRTPIVEADALYLQTGADTEGYATVGEVVNLARLVPAYRTGRYYPMHPVFRATQGPVMIGNARTYLTPFIPPRDIAIDRVFVKTWGGGTGASLAAVAIYAGQTVAGGHWPTGMPVATGVSTFVPNAGFNTYEKALAEGTVTLKAGKLYFAALQCNEAITFYANDLQFSIAMMGSATAEFDSNSAALVSGNGVSVVGTWEDLTTSPTSGNYGAYAPQFQLGMRIA